MKVAFHRGHQPDGLIGLALLLIILAILVPAGARIHRLVEAKRAAGVAFHGPDLMHAVGGGIGLLFFGSLAVVAALLAFTLAWHVLSGLWANLMGAREELESHWKDPSA